MALLLSLWFLRKNLFKGKAPFFSTSFEFYTIYFTPPKRINQKGNFYSFLENGL